MAVTRGKNSGVYGSKYISFNAGYPGVMPAPTAADGGTGSTATVSFTNVSGISSYTAISTPGNFTGTASSSPITVSGLTAGTAYTFQVAAINAVGQGGYSAASNSVTPAVPTSYFSIATAYGNGSSPTITFNSIPQTYKHLQIRTMSRDQAGGNASSDLLLQFNGVGGTFYDNQWAYGAGSYPGGTSNSIDNNSAYAKINRANEGTAAAGNYYGCSIIDITDYSSTVKNKSARARSGTEDSNTVFSTTSISSATIRNTAAITSITITNGFGNNFNSTSIFALYGIKG